jgi:GT2 family glycosyltransferase
MQLSIVILNWNAAVDTIRCVGHISSWRRLQPDIWVVDNGSTDESAKIIAQACPGVHLIQNAANLGFGGGNNLGLVAALAASEAPILLLNNDAFITEDAVISLAKTLQTNESIGFIGPLLFDAEQADHLLAAGGRNPVKHHHSHLAAFPPNQPIYPVEYVPGTVIMGRAEVFRTVGLLDEAYFFATEIADLCRRARQQGYVSVIDTRARATHTLGRSSHLRHTLHPYYIIRNRFLFIRKFHASWKPLFYAFWTFYSLALSFKVQINGEVSMARAVRLGLLDGLQGRFGGQNERVVSITSGEFDHSGP